MMSSAIVLGGVVVMMSVGYGVATGLEWFHSVEIKPKKKSKKGGDFKHDGVTGISKKLESRG